MLQNLSASEGQLVVFECRVKGAPSPKVEWYREGTLIEDSPDFRILQKSKLFKIIFPIIYFYKFIVYIYFYNLLNN